MWLLLWSTLAVLLSTSHYTVKASSCLDDNGNAVDWFIGMKMPYVKGTNNGVEYVYIDSNSPIPYTFTYNSAHVICDYSNSGLHACVGDANPISSIGRTTIVALRAAGIASNPNEGYMFYNDEVPNGGNNGADFGHTKGYLHFDATGGYWMVHSVPQGPDANHSNFIYQANGATYGQNFLCLSLPLSQIEIVAQQLQLTFPQTYSANFPSSSIFASMTNTKAALTFLSTQYANFVAGISRTNPKSKSNIAQITTVGGVIWTHFAKTGTWGSDIYSQLIVPHYQTALACETWIGGTISPVIEPAYHPTSATVVKSSGATVVLPIAFDTVNINSVSIPGFSFTDGQDHSKWAVSMYPSVPAVCMGDINRQNTQFSRGGGLLCIESASLHQLFLSMATSTDCTVTSGSCVTPTAAEMVYPSSTDPLAHSSAGSTTGSTTTSTTISTTSSQTTMSTAGTSAQGGPASSTSTGVASTTTTSKTTTKSTTTRTSAAGTSAQGGSVSSATTSKPGGVVGSSTTTTQKAGGELTTIAGHGSSSSDLASTSIVSGSNTIFFGVGGVVALVLIVMIALVVRRRRMQHVAKNVSGKSEGRPQEIVVTELRVNPLGLPPGWTAEIDPHTHATYYFNASRGLTQWDPPKH